MQTNAQAESPYEWPNSSAASLLPETGGGMQQELQRVWQKLAFWMRVSAVFTLLFGLFQTCIGIINFGWGTIAGLLELVIAVLLLIMASAAKRLQANPGEEQTITKLARHLTLYFKLQAAFVFVFSFVIIMLVVTILQFLTDWDWLVHLVNEGKKLDKLVIKLQGWYETIADWVTKLFG
ncbi:DUF5362 family protein [Paenibacillus sp. FJAT-27812]|uniref:DUF5362 family protein n=1 Tax=Paenibacillus sp. FJAT-27812 TaxID=1684143 RepID=UPI0006A7A97B|nr:DUF5362 family protein [Paenibacillus sp. FJAT-27812]